MCFQVSHGAESSNTAQHLPHQLEEEHVNTQHKIFRALQQRMQLSLSGNQQLLQGTLDELQGINSDLQLSTVQLLKAVPELKQEFEAEVQEVLSLLFRHLGCEVLFLSLTQPFHNRIFFFLDRVCFHANGRVFMHCTFSEITFWWQNFIS